MEYTRKPGDNRIVKIFENIGDYLEYVNKGSDRTGRGASQRPDSEDGWTGTKSFAAAVALQREGWHQSRPKVDALLEPLREKLADRLGIVSERSHDIIGYEPDIDRFLAGELECMFEDVFVEAPKMGKVHTLLISGVVNAYVTADELMKRGVAIVALVEAFQMVGTDLEIWLEDSYGSPDGKRTFTTLVRLHQAGQNLDIDQIMFPLAHPSWLRRFSFAACEANEQSVRKQFGFYYGHGYGRAKDFLVNDIVNPNFTMSKGGSMKNGHKLDSDPLGFILQTLKDQGVFQDEDDWGD